MENCKPGCWNTINEERIIHNNENLSIILTSEALMRNHAERIETGWKGVGGDLGVALWTSCGVGGVGWDWIKNHLNITWYIPPPTTILCLTPSLPNSIALALLHCSMLNRLSSSDLSDGQRYPTHNKTESYTMHTYSMIYPTSNNTVLYIELV